MKNRHVKIRHMWNRRIKQTALVAFVLFAGAGCQDLDIVNTNAPDRERALQEPASLEALIGGAFDVFYGGVTDTWQVSNNYANYVEHTTTSPWWATVQMISEPRTAFNNAPDVPNFTGPRGPRALWADLSEVLSTTYDGLRAIRLDGATFMDGATDNTPRAEAFSLFMRGWAMGYLAMLHDEVVVIPYDVELGSDVAQQVEDALTPYGEAVEVALDHLEEAITVAEANDVSFPSHATSNLWFGTEATMTTQQFVELANTIAARILVLSARTPAERAGLDWDRVETYTASGLTSDFEVILEPNFRDNFMYTATQAEFNTAWNYRLNYRIIGPADTSGEYQAWINAAPVDRNRFNIATPDRRITGPSYFNDGAYVRFRAHNFAFNETDGLYLFSAYQWARHAHEVGVGRSASGQDEGTARMASADENNLLRAEALLHLEDAPGARDLVNISRTREHTLPDDVTYPGLPAATTDGAPDSAPGAGDCVPRQDDGDCADLMTALRYERMLELVSFDAVRGYADSRGFGILPDGSWLQQPVPGNELDLIGAPVYTHGGIGDEWGAVYAPVEM